MFNAQMRTKKTLEIASSNPEQQRLAEPWLVRWRSRFLGLRRGLLLAADGTWGKVLVADGRVIAVPLSLLTILTTKLS